MTKFATWPFTNGNRIELFNSFEMVSIAIIDTARNNNQNSFGRICIAHFKCSDGNLLRNEENMKQT